ncbi:LuxR family transcriptional regulator [Adlercreutzia sp. R21]|uniref:LuxR family transcriptional regulator n=1 Tax=Adlercreutzia wanghongyangiae TaxID=3111451 RepID=A0ABU6IJQ6_9ACTN|nr:LuxR family transcriptional regulator [Adlercreutzia sp. R21]MEC4176644.1 LuxR family transcriptional regulator [Adlercreutzia sp. R7]MEC4184903.1 LuxR family transcriptional regulator [Adlercreutzia sp. R21]
MAKLSMGYLRKRVQLAAFNFDVRPGIVAGFALHWTWVWVTFWSQKFYQASPAPAGTPLLSLEPLWLLSIASNVLCYGALFVWYLRGECIRRPAAAAWAAAAVTSVGTALIGLPAEALAGGSAGFVAGALLTGVGSAVEVVLWASLIAGRGARQVVVYSVLATLAGSGFFFVLTLLPAAAARWITVLIPVAEMWLLTHQQAAEAASPACDADWEVPALRPIVEIGAISLFFGFSYGMMKGFFAGATDDLIAIRDILNVSALILGAVAILLTMSVLRMDFRHMTYQVALPLMAAGFVLYSLGYPCDLIGFAAHQMGYQYFYIIIWALWAVLAYDRRSPVALFASVSMMAIMIGQLTGSVLGAQLMALAHDRYTVAVIAACSVFVILLVALFAFESPFPGSDRNLFSAPGSREAAAPRFKLSVQQLAQSRGLSPRETEVFSYLARGRNCSFISAQLVISEETAKTHIKRIYRKFGVHSQQALLDLIELDGHRPSEP